MSFLSRLFGKREDKFSLANLQELYKTLMKNPVATERNRNLIIETLREIAEVLIWGDQHDNQFFDFFLEKNILAYFIRIMKEKTDSTIHVQLLQTLSILVENISNETSIFYLLSNNHVNEIITNDFDFSDEEVLAYYISFLKTLSLKLNERTVQFFFHEARQEFPLYTEAVKFFNNGESMVRVGVRTLTLAVFKVEEEGVRRFIVGGKAAPYFNNLVWFISDQSHKLDALLAGIRERGADGRSVRQLRDAVDELTDLFYYIHDIFNLGLEDLNRVLAENLTKKFFLPLLVGSLEQKQGYEEAREGDELVHPVVSFFVLTLVFQTIKYDSLVNEVARVLIHPEEPLRTTLLKHLSGPDTHVLGSCCVLYGILQNGQVDQELLEASHLLPFRLKREKRLLGKLLGEDNPPDSPGSSDPSKEALVTVLLETLRRSREYRLVTLQMLVLLLKKLVVSAPMSQPELSESHWLLLEDAYLAATVPLRREFKGSLGTLFLELFEDTFEKHRPVDFMRLTAAPLLFLNIVKPRPQLSLESGQSSEHKVDRTRKDLQRWMVLHELRYTLMCLKDDNIPLKPRSISLPSKGNTYNVVDEHHDSFVALSAADGRLADLVVVLEDAMVVVVEEDSLADPSEELVEERSSSAAPQQLEHPLTASEESSASGKRECAVVCAFPMQTVEVSFAVGGLELTCSATKAKTSVYFEHEDQAMQCKQAIERKKNALIDSKMEQLVKVLGVE